MKIKDIISKVKDNSSGIYHGKQIDDKTTRDQVLFGEYNLDYECSGIIVTCFASIEIIKQAIDKGYNFIICHEALFWNHGDHTDWLQDNKVYLEKSNLLKENNIVVWRSHDYIHSKIKYHDKYVDGIFYGLYKELGWEEFIVDELSRRIEFDKAKSSKEIADTLINKCNLNGLRLVGSTDAMIKKIIIPNHMFGMNDNEIINDLENNDIDAILSMEMVDYSVNEYIRDSSMLNKKRVAFCVGHFNLEEPGMKFFSEWLTELLKLNDCKIEFIQSGDVFKYYESNI